jgi:hypothetical protein
MDASSLRLVAHVGTVGLLLAAIGTIMVSQGRQLNWRYWRLLCCVLAVYACWFFMLSISLRDMELLKRSEMVWSLGLLEFTGAVGGWVWLVATMRLSFRFTRRHASTSQVSLS